MVQLADTTVLRIAAFYIQPDHLRFPFRLPQPDPHGIRLRKGWVHVVSMDTLEKMGGQNQARFLCTFPVTILVQGGGMEGFRTGCRLRIGQAEARVTICGDVCGTQSQSCGFADACTLRTEAIMAEVYKEGLARAGDVLLRIHAD